jgi:hypothetical protein
MKAILFRAIAIAAPQLFVATLSPFAALPNGASVLRAMTTYDDQLAAGGFTIEGTKIQLPGKITFPVRENRRAGPAARFKWKFTASAATELPMIRRWLRY